jgi:hypothetical protein
MPQYNFLCRSEKLPRAYLHLIIQVAGLTTRVKCSALTHRNQEWVLPHRIILCFGIHGYTISRSFEIANTA